MKYTKLEHGYILIWAKKIAYLNSKNWKCEKCNKSVIISDFDVHHLRDKEIEIKQVWGLSSDEAKKELDKCILVCSKCHRKIHYIKQGVSKKREKAREILFKYKGNNKCEGCKVKFDFIDLCFHHTKPENKKYNISREINYNRYQSIEKVQEDLLEELDDCDVLCFTCHRKIHFDFERFENYKEEIYRRIKSYKPQKKLNHKEVKKLFDGGLRQIDIARKLDVNKSTISTILKNYKK